MLLFIFFNKSNNIFELAYVTMEMKHGLATSRSNKRLAYKENGEIVPWLNPENHVDVVVLVLVCYNYPNFIDTRARSKGLNSG